MATSPSVPLTPPARQGNYAFAVSVALLLIRIVLGFTFFFHGSQKLFGWFTPDDNPTVAHLVPLLTSHPLPVFSAYTWAYIAAFGEFLGGILVFLGLLSRLATLPILVTMFVAIATVHGPNGFGGTMEFAKLASGGNAMILHPGYEFNLALIALAAAILIAGPGPLSIDAFLFRRSLYARGPQPLDNPTPRQ